MRMLRHGSVQVTRGSYIKIRDNNVTQAMQRRSAAFVQFDLQTPYAQHATSADVVDNTETEAHGGPVILPVFAALGSAGFQFP